MNVEGRGTDFEYQLCKLFQKQGFFVRRAIPVKTDELKDVTDVDVLAINTLPMFRYTKVICDCKNKQKPKPYERILWTKGLGIYLNIEETYIALPKATQDVFYFAKQCDVKILTKDKISKLVNGYNFGYTDDSFYLEFFKGIELLLKDKEYIEICKYINVIKQQYLSNKPYMSFNIAIVALSKMTKLIDNNSSKELMNLIKYVIAESSILLCYSFINICNDLLGINDTELRNYVSTKLAYGNDNPDSIKYYLESFTKYANEVIKSKVPSEFISGGNIIRPIEIKPPKYTADLIGIIGLAVENPN